MATKPKAIKSSGSVRAPRLPKREETAAACWLERTNPLAGVSIRTAQNIFDCARAGDTQRLHWLFQEIEAANPILMTCVERRTSAVSNFRWQVTAKPSADESLGNEQKDAAELFVSGIENLTETLEHLDLAFFRGFSFTQPIWEADGTVREIVPHASWEFLHHGGRLWHNPSCDGFGPGSVDCTDAGLIGMNRSRAIDYPALSIHIRSAVGERDWGRFLERHGQPKPAVTMAPNATNEQRADYIEAAKCVERGQVSVWPSGTMMNDFAGGSRGMDPFSAFIRHQEELIVLLATGGTLTSLASADTGSLAGGAQMEVWKEIVRRDSGVLAQTIFRGLVRPYLERTFPGRQIAVDFTLDIPSKPSAQESATVAATLKSAGWRVNQAELEKAVGFSLEREETPQLEMPSFGAAKARPEDRHPQDAKDSEKSGDAALADAFALLLAESMADELGKADETRLQNDDSRLQNAPRHPDAQRHPEPAEGA